MSHRIAIIGAGPAAWLAASELHARGCPACVIAPNPHADWPATYGVWETDIPVWASGMVRARWDNAVVRTARSQHHLSRSYLWLDAKALAARLHVPVQTIDARVTSVRPGVVTTDSGELEFDLILDASGAAQVAGGIPASRYQLASGRRIAVKSHQFPLRTMVLMDWRQPVPSDLPSFLYCMPLSETELFMEETILATSRDVGFQDLFWRLEQRMEQLGLVAVETLAEEQVRIGLDAEPSKLPGVVSIGAAGGWVHPATGYHLGQCFRRMPRLAGAIANASRPDLHRDALRAASSPSEDRARGWHLRGLSVLDSLPPRALDRFFEAFFTAPRSAWGAYLDGAVGGGATAASMAALFVSAPADVQRTMMRALVRSSGRRNL